MPVINQKLAVVNGKTGHNLFKMSINVSLKLRQLLPFESGYTLYDRMATFWSKYHWIFTLSSANAFNSSRTKLFSLSGKGLNMFYATFNSISVLSRIAINRFPNKPWCVRVCSKSLLKTLWETEKLLVTSNFSFSHSVFNTFGELFPIFIKLKIVVCRLFQFGRL